MKKAANNDKWIERLRSQPLLRSMSTKDLHRIAPLFDPITLPAGTELTRQGRAGRETFLIEDGEVVVTIDGAEVARVGVGEVIGEMAVLDREPRNATVTAVTDVTALVVEARVFTALVREPEVGAAIATRLAARLRDAEGGQRRTITMDDDDSARTALD